ncbi:hypothetical protein CLOBL_32950 [Clostridium sp. BL-8]|nr:hypothetical protein CLOBL_32950 [Clostridium sp. BL-8]
MENIIDVNISNLFTEKNKTVSIKVGKFIEKFKILCCLFKLKLQDM